jgi:hypothetical protein
MQRTTARAQALRHAGASERVPLAERFPLLRPFPMAVFAIGAVLILFALSGARNASVATSDRAQASTPLVVRVAPQLVAPAAPVTLAGDGS